MKATMFYSYPIQRVSLFFFFMTLCAVLDAQNESFLPENYFQQEVHYTINVTLDDNAHKLLSQIKIQYINHSPDKLGEIYMHLWPNAFSSRNTAFARQLLESGNTNFHFADATQRGFIDSLHWTANGTEVHSESWNRHPDVVVLRLPHPLEPGDTLHLETPFRVRIPASFSRLGRVGQSYQLTQWYPKPAVYDREGWHPMPYLHRGEYYSSFGSFVVSITLPANYVVGATGVCVTPSEWVFIDSVAARTQATLSPEGSVDLLSGHHPIPPSDSAIKTITFEADNVHDFAWFADKRFYVERDTIRFESGREVIAYTMFTNEELELWYRHGIEYVTRSTEFYSRMVGEYPYPQVTALQSSLSAGAGMEYPMVTVIGRMGSSKLLDIVIAHEVGHNWFYGILATNERRFPWLDEGMNSYIERLYTQHFYGQPQQISEFIGNIPGLNIRHDMPLDRFAYRLTAGLNLHQPPDLHSEKFSEINYGVSCYMMPSHFFGYLEAYLGRDTLLTAFRTYYEHFKFRHPGPDDVRNVFETVAGKNLSWFFDDLIGSTGIMDYFILRAVKDRDGHWQLTVRNRGSVPGPFTISGLNNLQIMHTAWQEGFTGTQTIDFGRGNYDEFVIDIDEVSADLRPENNSFQNRLLFRRTQPFNFSMANLINQPDRTQFSIFPVVGYNVANGPMPGALMHNYMLPPPRFQFYAMPMIGTRRLSLNGSGRIAYNLQPDLGKIRRASPYFLIKSYSEERSFEFFSRYIKLEHGWNIDFKKPDHRNPREHETGGRILWLMQQSPQSGDESWWSQFDQRRLAEIYYLFRHTGFLDPYSIRITVTGEPQFSGERQDFSGYLKVSLEYNQSFLLGKRGHRFRARVFGGAFAYNADREFGAYPFALSMTPGHDYVYDHTAIDRYGRPGMLGRQTIRGMGGFKVPVSAVWQGASNSAILAANLDSDVPLPGLGRNFPVKPYADIGYFFHTFPVSRDDNSLWINAGLKLDLYLLEVYFPLWSNAVLRREVYDLFDSGYFLKTTFAFHFDRISNIAILRQIL